MKTIHACYIILITGLFAITMSSCKKSCSGENPRARIINNGTHKASVQIKTSGGNTININDVEAGSSSEYSSYAAGVTTFTLKVSNVDYVKTVTMTTCDDYDIAIDSNNNITITPSSRE